MALGGPCRTRERGGDGMRSPLMVRLVSAILVGGVVLSIPQTVGAGDHGVAPAAVTIPVEAHSPGSQVSGHPTSGGGGRGGGGGGVPPTTEAPCALVVWNLCLRE